MAEQPECICVGVLDLFGDCSVPAGEWMTNDHSDMSLAEKTTAYLSACAAMSSHKRLLPREEMRLRHEPYVAFNPAFDTYFFIFKFDNNGTTFLVGEGVSKLVGGNK